MNRFLSLLFLGSLAVAQAQVAPVQINNASLQLDACVPDNGQVRCDFTLTPDQEFGSSFSTDMVGYISAQGERRNAIKVRAADNKWESYSTAFIRGSKDIPLKLSFLLDAKPGTALRYLIVNDQRFANVPVGAARTSLSTGPAIMKNSGTTTTVTAGGFVITLSDCTKQGKDYRCASALLSPR